MGKRRSKLRGVSKLIIIWFALSSLAAYYYGSRYCEQRGDSLCDDGMLLLTSLAEAVSANLGAILLVVLFAAVALGLLRLFRREDTTSPGFKNFPEQYDGQTIRFVGKVEYILKDRLSERLKRKTTDIYRTAVKNGDMSNRFVHQRFLVSSPQLRRGERLMIHSNTTFGKLKLRKGRWFELQGEYVHRPGRGHAKQRRRETLYGLLHETHEPRGFAKALKGKPKEKLMQPVRVSRQGQNQRPPLEGEQQQHHREA